MTSFDTISVGELRAAFVAQAEIAVIDVREIGEFGEEHLLLATCLPLSRLEERAERLLPRKVTSVVVMDGGDGRKAAQAARILEGLQYEGVRILEDGVSGWREAGMPTYSGINVLSKAFGEFVHNESQTPDIEPWELKGRLDAGQKITLIDCRPFDEYARMNIPGSVCIPGVELSRKIFDYAADPAVPIVVNCAGRTRSIISAQSLLNLGLASEVYALRNGTMGWQLSGFTLEHGQSKTSIVPSREARGNAIVVANRLRERYGIAVVAPDVIREWKADYSTYVFDVREPSEAMQSRMDIAHNVPGGQLIQTLDEWVAVRNAHIVLMDDDGVRATMTASWLKQMGFDHVAVCFGISPEPEGKTVVGNGLSQHHETSRSLIGACEAVQFLNDDGQTVVVDYSTSREFEQGHIEGAYWALRYHDENVLALCETAERVIVTAHDHCHALIAAADLAECVACPVYLLEFDEGSWRDCGGTISSGPERMISPAIDVWLMPWELESAEKRQKAMSAYLSWEVGLTDQLSRDGVRFRTE